MGPPPIEMTWRGPTSVAWIDLRLGDDSAHVRLMASLANAADTLTLAALVGALSKVAPEDVIATIAGAGDLATCLGVATARAPGLERLPAIAPVIAASDFGNLLGLRVERPDPSLTYRSDVWTFLAIRSRVRGNAFVKASDPYLTATDLGTAAYVRVPSTWLEGARR